MNSYQKWQSLKYIALNMVILPLFLSSISYPIPCLFPRIFLMRACFTGRFLYEYLLQTGYTTEQLLPRERKVIRAPLKNASHFFGSLEFSRWWPCALVRPLPEGRLVCALNLQNLTSETDSRYIISI